MAGQIPLRILEARKKKLDRIISRRKGQTAKSNNPKVKRLQKKGGFAFGI